MSWYVYMLRCADETLYTGVTTDVVRRVREHNETALGAKYTRARRPVTLVFKKRYGSRSTAQKAEAALKQLSREAKILLLDRK